MLRKYHIKVNRKDTALKEIVRDHLVVSILVAAMHLVLLITLSCALYTIKISQVFM